MPFTPTQINEFKRRVKIANPNISDEEIEAEIGRKAQELYARGTQAPQDGAGGQGALQAPAGGFSMAGSQQPASQGGTAAPSLNLPPAGEQQGGFVSNFIKGLVEPALEYGKLVGEAGAQVGRIAFDPVFRKAVLGEELTPEENKKLGESNAYFLHGAKEGEEKFDDTGKTVMTGLKATAGAESYAVPFGKGASLLSKVFIPGAVAGGLSEVSRKDATAESVAESAVTGAASAGVVHGIGGMLSWVRGKGGELVRQGDALQEGTRKISVKPSVYGASKEKAINQTLDKYGFQGSAQAQYEKLEPVMNDIESQVQQFVTDNPDVKVSPKDIKQAFMKNLRGSLRTKDLTNKQAQDEIKGYLNDLLLEAGVEQAGDAGGQALTQGNGAKDLSLGTLRQMKKVLNEDYGSVYKKIEAGTGLNPREKVIAAAWDSLDDAIRDVAPELKSLLVDESHLYQAARSLASARTNPATFRAAGFSIPAVVTQKLRDLGSGVLRKLGLGAEKLPEGGKFTQETLERLAALSPAALKERGLSDEEIQKVTELSQSMQAGGTPPLGGAPLTGAGGEQSPPGGMNQPETLAGSKPEALNPFGNFSKRQVLSLALSQGASKKDLEDLSGVYDMLAVEDPTAVSTEKMKVADSLREEYFKRTKENQFIDVVNSYKKVVSTSDSAAGDVSLVFAFMKIIDPGSVVREGEFATAENTAGIPDQIRKQYNKALSGARLSQEQRAAFKHEAGRVFEVYQERQTPIDAYYQSLARRYGIDPSLLGVGLYQP